MPLWSDSTMIMQNWAEKALFSTKKAACQLYNIHEKCIVENMGFIKQIHK